MRLLHELHKSPLPPLSHNHRETFSEEDHDFVIFDIKSLRGCLQFFVFNLESTTQLAQQFPATIVNAIQEVTQLVLTNATSATVSDSIKSKKDLDIMK